MRRTKPILGRVLPALIAVAVVLPAAGQAQTSAAIDPEAMKLLKRSTDYLAGLKSFNMDAASSVEAVMPNGQKLQFDHRAVITVKRPNKMRVERVGELVSQTFYYDGKSLSISMPAEGFHATVAAPATLEETLDFARDQLDVIAPGADLVYKNAYALLTDGLTSATVIGENVVGGVRCDHLAFRNAEVDWQICIQQGAKPLPLKMVVTSKKMPQAPNFAVVLSKWNTSPKITDGMFSFTPAKGSRQIEFLPAASAAKK